MREGKGTMKDHRDDKTTMSNKIEIGQVEMIETFGQNNDYCIYLKNGDEHWFRCSCCDLL